jgi:hypothetical protein
VIKRVVELVITSLPRLWYYYRVLAFAVEAIFAWPIIIVSFVVFIFSATLHWNTDPDRWCFQIRLQGPPESERRIIEAGYLLSLLLCAILVVCAAYSLLEFVIDSKGTDAAEPGAEGNDAAASLAVDRNDAAPSTDRSTAHHEPRHCSISMKAFCSTLAALSILISTEYLADDRSHFQGELLHAGSLHQGQPCEAANKMREVFWMLFSMLAVSCLILFCNPFWFCNRLCCRAASMSEDQSDPVRRSAVFVRPTDYV